MNSTSSWVTINTSSGPMRGYLSRPKEPADRAVIVLQEAFGVNAHIQDVADRFAKAGFLALAPDLFHRTGFPELSYDQHKEAVSLISQIGAQAIVEDALAALSYLQGEEDIERKKTAIVGFCFGGRAAFTAATRIPDIGAAVVFYGPGIAAGPHASLDRASGIAAPLLLHVGADDPTIPAGQVKAIEDTLNAAGIRFTQHVYPEAGHAFLCDARPAMYREKAAVQAWARTIKFLNEEISAGNKL